MEKELSKVRTLQQSVPIHCHNHMSGHQWTEFDLLQKWDVTGPYGHISTHNSEAKAQEVAAEWQEYYDKHPQA